MSLRRKNTGCLAIVSAIIIIILIENASAVRINEIELNPVSEDRGKEWIELYSSEKIDLNDWKIMNDKGKNITLNFSFSDYRFIVTPYQFLTNERKKIYLINNEDRIIDETEEISDRFDDTRSWNYCGGNLTFTISSKGRSNICEDESDKVEISNKISDEENTSANERAEEIEEGISMIYLTPKDIKSDLVYKSKNQMIKEYAIYGFVFLCILLIVFILFGRRKRYE